MRLVTLIFATLALAAVPAEASRYVEPLLAPLTGEGYQYDGGVAFDASDACRAPRPEVLLGSPPTTGTLVPVDDPEDNYALFVSVGMLGVPITVTLQEAPFLQEAVPGSAPGGAVSVAHYDLQVWTPGCQRPAADEDVAGGGERVVFVPERAGTYSIRIVPGSTAGPIEAMPLAEPGSLLDPHTRTCHGFCIVKANGLVGYSLATSA